jgi:hypothetical protein
VGYEDRAGLIATELAVHFERGRDYPRAVRYLRSAGENAVLRSAYREAIAHLTRALALLSSWGRRSTETVETHRASRAHRALALGRRRSKPRICTRELVDRLGTSLGGSRSWGRFVNAVAGATRGARGRRAPPRCAE